MAEGHSHPVGAGEAHHSRPVGEEKHRSHLAAGEERHSHPVGAADHIHPAVGEERRSHRVVLGAARYIHPVVAAGEAERHSHLAGVGERRSRPAHRMGVVHSHRVALRVARRAECARLRSLSVPPSVRAIAPPSTLFAASMQSLESLPASIVAQMPFHRDNETRPNMHDDSTDDHSVRAAIPHVNATISGEK